MLEGILRFSIQYRHFVVLVTVALAWLGWFSLKRLPIDAVPDITNNQIQINTAYPGFSPIDVEKQITYPIETTLLGIEGLEYTRSLSRNGFSQVTAVFRDDVDIYFARQQVNERLSEARESLPSGAEPTMGPIATGLGEVYMWAVQYLHTDGRGAPVKDGEPGWQSDGSYLTPEHERLSTPLERMAYLRTVQDWIIRPQLKGVEGVAGIDSIGGYVKQYQVQPDPMKLYAYGLTFQDVIKALEDNNLSTGAGYVERKGEYYVVRAYSRVSTIEEIGNIVIAAPEGTPIYVRDVAEIGIGRELRTGAASENGREVVIGTALMRIGENSRTVSAAVDAKLQVVNKNLPPDIHAKPVSNRMGLVDATIATVRNNLIEGAILVTVVLFLILGNIRAAVITACVIPLSMLMAATGMVRAGISGNLMSLGAIDFGLIVDGAVIIVENCLRRLAEKQQADSRRLTLLERLHEVRLATMQVVRPAVFGQAIIIVYLPLLTLTGVEGKMFYPMAATVILALFSAFMLSFTFVPAMVAIAFSGKIQERENYLVQLAKRAYRPLVIAALKFRYAVLGMAVVLLAGALWLFTTLGQEFLPTLDEKRLAVQALRIPSTSLTQSLAMQSAVEKTISQFPEVAFVFSKTGTAEMATDPMPQNLTDTFVMLKPQREWPNPSQTKDALIERLEAALNELPGNLYEFTQPIELRFNELISGIRSDVAVKVYGDEFQPMLNTARSIARILKDVPGSADVKVEQVEGLPAMNVVIDRGAIARYGLNVADIQDIIAIAVGGHEAGLVFEGDRRFDLIVRLPDELRRDPASMRQLPIPLPRRPNANHPEFIPLSEVARIELTEGPNQVSRENGKRRVVVQANVRGRDLGSFVTESQQRIEKNVRLPAGY